MRRWATPVYTLVLIAIAVTAWSVLQEAQSAVLESQSGSVSSVENDPTAPGFRAFTEPTPTGLVLHTRISSRGGAELAGATVLLSAGDVGGGTIVSVPAAFGLEAPLGETFETEGFVPVLRELKEIFGIGFGEVVVLDSGSWTALMAKDLPLPMTLRTDLVADDGRVLVAAGTRDFSLEEVAVIASHRNAGDVSLTVSQRQQDVWKAWVGRTAASPELPPELAVDEGFLDLIATLTRNEVSYRIADFTAGSSDFYRADADALQNLVATLVPFPEPIEPGGRETVMLLDGTGGEIEQRRVLSSVVIAGGTVSVLGNTSELVAESVVQVHNPESWAFAQRLATILGATVMDAPSVDSPSDVTVIIGADSSDGP